MKEQLRQYAARLGFCALGVAPARLEPDFARRLTGSQPPFVRYRPEQRCAACSWLPGARSVLVAAWPYHDRYTQPLAPAEDEGYFSPVALAPDYHQLVREKLEQLGQELVRLLPGTRFVTQVDAGPGCERLYAVRAGVGWQGKNNFIIVPGHGSLVWLGLVTTDGQIEPDTPLAAQCGDCTRCLDACPTNAYLAPHKFLHLKCMAYWASSNDELSREQCQQLARHRILYGCDICQLACPHTRASGRKAVEWPKLAAILHLSNSQFRHRFGATAAAWRGRQLLRRNAVIASWGRADLKRHLQQLADGDGAVARYASRVLRDWNGDGDDNAGR